MQDTGAYHHSLHRTLQENPSCSPCNHATHDSCALLFDNVQHGVVPMVYLSLEDWANRVTIISKPMVKDIYYIRIKCDRPSSV